VDLQGENGPGRNQQSAQRPYDPRYELLALSGWLHMELDDRRAPSRVFFGRDLPVTAQPLEFGELIRETERVGVRRVLAFAALLDATDRASAGQATHGRNEPERADEGDLAPPARTLDRVVAGIGLDRIQSF
jgi:hypothetical protein